MVEVDTVAGEVDGECVAGKRRFDTCTALHAEGVALCVGSGGAGIGVNSGEEVLQFVGGVAVDFGCERAR